MKRFLVICLEIDGSIFVEGTHVDLVAAEKHCADLRNPENNCGDYGQSAKVIMVEF